MNTQIKWVSEIIAVDIKTGEELLQNTPAHSLLNDLKIHNYEIIKKTSTAKVNPHNNTAKRTIHWHCQKIEERQCKLFG